MNHYKDNRIIEKRIRTLTLIFMTGLILSGITAFPLESELKIIEIWSAQHLNESSSLREWIHYVYTGVKTTNIYFPFMAYGTDWLAFSHIVISIFFIGVLINPARNIFILKAGMAACLLVIPLALIAGYIRDIPLYWRFIDCSFGIFGIIPLAIAYQLTLKLRPWEEFDSKQLYKQKGELEKNEDN